MESSDRWLIQHRKEVNFIYLNLHAFSFQLFKGERAVMHHSRAEMWSATPTPFHQDLSIDAASVSRMVEHQRRLGVTGLMLGGTCGEGPWMTAPDLCELTRRSVAASAGGMTVTVQVTDNSPRRILERAEKVAEAGAQIAGGFGAIFPHERAAGSFVELLS